MKNVVDINFLRERFLGAAEFYKKQGIAPQPSILRIEEDLVNGQGVYTFDLKKENVSQVERNLKRNDLFVTVGIGVALRIENTDAPNSTVPMFAPHKAIVDEDSAVVVPGFATDDIKALYNGSLYIATGTTVNITDMPTALFLKDHGTNDSEPKIDHFDFADDLRTMPEEVIFSGTQDHTVKVSFPTFALSDYQAMQSLIGGDPETYGENFKAKIVFIAFGYRIVSGTLPSYRVPENPYANCI